MDEYPERPESLARAPRPAPDEHIDPADLRTDHPHTTHRRQGPAPSAPFSTRLDLDVLEKLEDMAYARRTSKKALVNEAVRMLYQQEISGR